MNEFKKIALFAHVGRKNLGDEATFEVTLKTIKQRHPSAEILALTANAADSTDRHGVPADPIRRSTTRTATVDETAPVHHEVTQVEPASSGSLKKILKSIPFLWATLRALRDLVQGIQAIPKEISFLREASKRLKGTDLFVVTGGGQLQDYFEGPWGYPFTIAKWCYLARRHKAKIVFLAVGAGPFTTRLGRFFLRRSLLSASYVSFRDVHSQRLATQELRLPHETCALPDVVNGIDVPIAFDPVRPPVEVVGINPLPFYDPRYWAVGDEVAYQKHVETVISFAAYLLESGKRVVFFPTQLRADPLVIEDIVEALRNRLPSLGEEDIACPTVSSIEDLADAISKTDMVMGSRYHGIIFSLRMGRPVIGLAYNPKTTDLLAQVGLGEYVIDIDQADSSWLIERFEQAQVNLDELRKSIESRTAEFRAELSKEFDTLFGPIASTPIHDQETPAESPSTVPSS